MEFLLDKYCFYWFVFYVISFFLIKWNDNNDNNMNKIKKSKWYDVKEGKKRWKKNILCLIIKKVCLLNCVVNIKIKIYFSLFRLMDIRKIFLILRCKLVILNFLILFFCFGIK